MSTIRYALPPRRGRRFLQAALLIGLVLWGPAQASAQTSAFLRSLVMPGAGQAHQGRLTRAALFAGVAVLTGAGLAVSTVHYNEAVNDFRDERRRHFKLQQKLSDGNVVSEAEINSTYAAMVSAFERADDRLVWRNVFLVSFLSVYTLNLVDVVIGRPDPSDVAQPPHFTIEVEGERLMLTRSFRF